MAAFEAPKLVRVEGKEGNQSVEEALDRKYRAGLDKVRSLDGLEMLLETFATDVNGEPSITDRHDGEGTHPISRIMSLARQMVETKGNFDSSLWDEGIPGQKLRDTISRLIDAASQKEAA